MPIVIGFHAIEETLKQLSKAEGNTLHVSRHPGPRVKKLIDLARSRGVAITNSPDEELSRLANESDHRGAVLETAAEIESDEPDFETCLKRLTAHITPTARFPLILALDSITDPHNLGAIIRSADKFGVDLILLPSRRSAQETETVRKSSAGASSWVQTVVVPNLHRALLACRDAGFWVVAADMDGVSATEFDAKCSLVLIMGNEGKGIGKFLRETSDLAVSIPCTGHVDSLNVSVASGILLYEIRRQQGFQF